MSKPAAAVAAVPAASSSDQNLVDRTNQAMRDRGLSQAQCAGEIGISVSRFHPWLKGSYDGRNDEIERKVANWLKQVEAQAAAKLPAVPAWVATETAARIEEALSYAQLAADMAVIYGGAGVGKTVAARRYAEHNPAAWHATVTPATGRTLGQALRHIARALGLRQLPQISADLEALLVQRLRGTRGLLMLDEAQHLCPAALETVRALHDAAGIGVALLGNELCYARLTGGDRAPAYAQLFSRLGKRLHLGAPTTGDVAAIAKAWGLDGAAARRAAAIAAAPGALRGLTKTLRFAAIMGDLAAATIRDAQAALTEGAGAA